MARKRIAVLLALLLILLPCAAAEDIVIPPNTVEIRAEAFMNTSVSSVALPDGLAVIGDRAFFNTGLLRAEIPATVTSVGRKAFDPATPITLVVHEGSAAQDWCWENNVFFLVKDHENTMPAIYAQDEDFDYDTGEWTCDIITSADTSCVCLLDGDGTEIHRWTSGWQEDAARGERAWTLEFTFAVAFSGRLRPMNDAVRGNDQIVEIDIGSEFYDSDALMESFSLLSETLSGYFNDIDYLEYPFTAGDPISFDIATGSRAEDTPVQSIRLRGADDTLYYRQDGLALGADASVNMQITFTQPGTYEVFAEATADGTNWETFPESKAIAVELPGRLLGAVFQADSLPAGVPVRLSALAMPGTARIGLFDGADMLASWEQYSNGRPLYSGTYFDDEDYYNHLEYTFSQPGSYHLTVKASPDGTDWTDPGVETDVEVFNVPSTYRARFDRRTAWNAAELWVTTDTTAETLRLEDEDGDLVDIYSAADCAEENEDTGFLDWEFPVDLSALDGGVQNFSISAGNASGYGAAKRAAVYIRERYAVNYIEIDDVGAGEDAPVMVEAEGDARYMKLYLDGAELQTLDADDAAEWDDESGTAVWSAVLDAPSFGHHVLGASLSPDGTQWTPISWQEFYVHDNDNPYSVLQADFHPQGQSLSVELSEHISGALDDVAGVRLVDKSSAVLQEWVGDDLAAQAAIHEYAYWYEFAYTFDAPGVYDVLLMVTADQQVWQAVGARCFRADGSDLALYSDRDCLEAEAGTLRYRVTEISDANGYSDIGLPYRLNRPMLTPIGDPGSFFWSHTYIKLDQPGVWNVYGLEIGMSYAQMCGVMAQRNLEPSYVFSWKIGDTYYLEVGADVMTAVIVRFEDGAIAEIRVSDYAGV